jgi:hypothetical protein
MRLLETPTATQWQAPPHKAIVNRLPTGIRAHPAARIRHRPQRSAGSKWEVDTLTAWLGPPNGASSGFAIAAPPEA